MQFAALIAYYALCVSMTKISLCTSKTLSFRLCNILDIEFINMLNLYTVVLLIKRKVVYFISLVNVTFNHRIAQLKW